MSYVTTQNLKEPFLLLTPYSLLLTSYSLLLIPVNYRLAFILLAFTLLTLYQSATLPLGEADDETDHYQYLQFVARTGRPPLTETERHTAGYKGGLAPLYYELTAWPIAWVGTAARPDVRRLDQRPERHIPTDGLGFNRVLHTLDEQWVWRGQVLAWHLVRLLSLPMAWLTLLTTYALGRRLWPAPSPVPFGAVVFMAFLPRFIISSAVINDDNLVFALSTLLLFIEILILQGDTRTRIFIALGLLFGLAVLTKYFSLILLPEICLTLWLSRRTPHILRLTTYSFIALLLTAGPWFGFIIMRFQRVAELGWIPGLAASLGEPQITNGLVNLLSGQASPSAAVTYPLIAWFGLLYRSFWFEYGWMELFAPNWVYGCFTIFLLLALLGYFPKPHRFLKPVRFEYKVLVLRLALFLFVVLMRYILSATLDTGQGRHLYTALPVIALFISLGLHRFVASLLPPYFLLLTSYSLFSTIILLNHSLILNHYPTMPVTSTPPDQLTIPYRQHIPLAKGLSFIGFDTPREISAGEALPVTLYWHADQEARQDYLLSLCLQTFEVFKTSEVYPVACWRGHFVNGRYPARAWEAGDTLQDTIYMPIPSQSAPCPASYRLKLTVWPLASNIVIPTIEAPVLEQIFEQPLITIQPINKEDLPKIEVWQADHRLTDSKVKVKLNETISYIDYTVGQASCLLSLDRQDACPTTLSTPLYSSCGDDKPFAQADFFIAHAVVPGGSYEIPLAKSTIIFSPRQRQTGAVFATAPVFGDQLAPLSLKLPNQSLDLTGFKNLLGLNPYILHPTETVLPLTIRWQAQQWQADPLVVSLKLLDKDFAVGGERVAPLGGRYPNILWTPTEIVEETYPLQLRPHAPAGLYRLEMSLLCQDKALPNGYEFLPINQAEHLYPLTIRLLDVADGMPPPISFTARLSDSIHLLGYDLSKQTESISLALYWQNEAKIATDYTVFTQLLGPDGQVYAQWDNPPQAGRYPTTAWANKDTVVDRYTLTLRPDAPTGNYRLLVGMYDALTGERLPATINGQLQPNNALELSTLSWP